MRNTILKATGTSLFASMCCATAYCQESKPNVIIIFIDDIGYGDIGPYGSEISPTPNMQRLADDGISHSDFYLSSVQSTPSRTALLTGCYASSVGMGYRVLFGGDARGLSTEEVVMPEVFKSKGYVTGCFGKWHLGDNPKYMPLAHGFDEYEGIPYSNCLWVEAPQQWTSLPYIKGNDVVAKIDERFSQAILTDVTSDCAVDFIERHKDNPFLLYLPYSSVHDPRYLKKEVYERNNGHYLAGQVEEIDNGVGRIIDTLKENGIYDNTLIILASDNGGGPTSSMGPFRGKKMGEAYEGRQRSFLIMTYPGKIKAGSTNSEILMSTDVLPSLCNLIGAEEELTNPIDGVDQLDLFFGREGVKSKIDTLYCEASSVFDYMRVGNMKLVKIGSKYELYDLSTDIGETTDIKDKYPERFEQMKSNLSSFAKSQYRKKRPSGFVANPKPLIIDNSNIPELYEYKDIPKSEVSDYIRQ